MKRFKLEVYTTSHRESTDAINRDVTLLVVGYVLIIIWAGISLNRNSWWDCLRTVDRAYGSQSIHMSQMQYYGWSLCQHELMSVLCNLLARYMYMYKSCTDLFITLSQSLQDLALE